MQGSKQELLVRLRIIDLDHVEIQDPLELGVLRLSLMFEVLIEKLYKILGLLQKSGIFQILHD